MVLAYKMLFWHLVCDTSEAMKVRGRWNLKENRKVLTLPLGFWLSVYHST